MIIYNILLTFISCALHYCSDMCMVSRLRNGFFTTEAVPIIQCHLCTESKDKHYVQNTLPHSNTELRTQVATQFKTHTASRYWWPYIRLHNQYSTY